MKKITSIAFASIVSMFVFSGSSFAEDFVKEDIIVSSPWSRATVDTAKVAGGFFEIKNTGQQADKLLSITANISDKVELHDMTLDDNVMKMREIETIDIPAQSSVTLKPGSMHVMFIGLKEQLKEGDSFPAVLHFEHAGDVDVKFNIESMSSKARFILKRLISCAIGWNLI